MSRQGLRQSPGRTHGQGLEPPESRGHIILPQNPCETGGGGRKQHPRTGGFANMWPRRDVPRWRCPVQAPDSPAPWRHPTRHPHSRKTPGHVPTCSSGSCPSSTSFPGLSQMPTPAPPYPEPCSCAGQAGVRSLLRTSTGKPPHCWCSPGCSTPPRHIRSHL